MTEITLKLEDDQITFLQECKKLGFKDKSSLVRTALERFKKDIEGKDLKSSADLYAELYKEDQGLQELTEGAIAGWPK